MKIVYKMVWCTLLGGFSAFAHDTKSHVQPSFKETSEMFSKSDRMVLTTHRVFHAARRALGGGHENALENAIHELTHYRERLKQEINQHPKGTRDNLVLGSLLASIGRLQNDIVGFFNDKRGKYSHVKFCDEEIEVWFNL